MNGITVGETALYSAELISWQETFDTSFAAADARAAGWDRAVADAHAAGLEDYWFLNASYCFSSGICVTTVAQGDHVQLKVNAGDLRSGGVCQRSSLVCRCRVLVDGGGDRCDVMDFGGFAGRVLVPAA
jgi:hypothetical protein